MIKASNAFRREVFEGNRRYLRYAEVDLADGTVLELENADFWSGGFGIDDAVSTDGNFDVGAAIINKFTMILNNIPEYGEKNGKFSSYVFEGAKIRPYIGLEINDVVERYQRGEYTVDSAKYNGQTIRVEALDNMSRFDLPYSESKLQYPATLDTIVRDACSVCDVLLGTYDFPHKNLVIREKPSGESTTFREVISWAAQVCGCFARCDSQGRLELKWYPQDALENVANGLDGGTFDEGTESYASGDTADGGLFNPWNTGYAYDAGTLEHMEDVHIISETMSHTIDVDDVIVTGVSATVKLQDGSDGTEVMRTYLKLADDQDVHQRTGIPEDGYIIGFENNPFITEKNATQIVTWLGDQLIGLRFRPGTLTHLSDPTIEAGDCALYFDEKGNHYEMFVSSTSFKPGETHTTKCSAKPAARNSAARFSEATKTYVELRKQLANEKTSREEAVEALESALDAKAGLYCTEETAQSGTIFYLHDKPELSDSEIVWKMTVEAWGVSTDGGRTYNAGMTVDGDTILRILTATGINAGWINTGQLVIKDENDRVTLFADTHTGVVRIVASEFSLSGGQTIAGIAEEKANAAVGGIEIGGRNLVLDSGAERTAAVTNSGDSAYTERYSFGSFGAGVIAENGEGDLFTVSFDYETVGAASTETYGAGLLPVISGSQGYAPYIRVGENEKGRYAKSFKLTDYQSERTPPQIQIRFVDAVAGATVKISNLKLEKGTKATTWSPAPEDISAESRGYTDGLISDVNSTIRDIQAQIDGEVDFYYYDYEPTLNNLPASEWAGATAQETEEIRKAHEGDAFLYLSTGYTYRFLCIGGAWQWMQIQDSGVAQAMSNAREALNNARTKMRVFTTQPSSEQTYDPGDLWVNATYGTQYTNDILKCKTAKTSGAAFSISHWEKASKYTDDTALSTFVNGTYANTIQNVQNQIDAKIETWHQPSDPSMEWTTPEAQNAHDGDLWFRTTDNTSWRWNGAAWVRQDAPDEVFDAIDGKAQIFTSQPAPPYNRGDLWVQGESGDILRCFATRKSGSFAESDWDKASKYTDDSAVRAQYGGCRTGAEEQEKTVDSPRFSLFSGAKIAVKFVYGNTAVNPTLNVNGTGAKQIRAYGVSLGEDTPFNWDDEAVVEFVYDGTYWNIADGGSMAKAMAYVDELDSTLTQQDVFNRLTNNLQNQGLYLENGYVYLNASCIKTGTLSASYIKGGSLVLGGENNGNGVLRINNSSGQRYALFNLNGLYIGNIANDVTNPKFLVTKGGDVKAKSFTADDYIAVSGKSGSYIYIPSSGSGYTELGTSGLEVRNKGKTVTNIGTTGWSENPSDDYGEPTDEDEGYGYTRDENYDHSKRQGYYNINTGIKVTYTGSNSKYAAIGFNFVEVSNNAGGLLGNKQMLKMDGKANRFIAQTSQGIGMMFGPGGMTYFNPDQTATTPGFSGTITIGTTKYRVRGGILFPYE